MCENRSKCVVCGNMGLNVGHMWQNPVREDDANMIAQNIWVLLESEMETTIPITNCTIEDGTAVMCGKHIVPYVCELCWYGMLYEQGEYIWNGQHLLVYDETWEEYIEWRGTIYKPVKNSIIQFEWDANTHRWVAMPK